MQVRSLDFHELPSEFVSFAQHKYDSKGSSDKKEKPLDLFFFHHNSTKQLASFLSQDYVGFIEVHPELQAPDKLTFLDTEQIIFGLSLTSQSTYRHSPAIAICDALTTHAAIEEQALTNMKTALHECITNALIHGNLEIHRSFSNLQGLEDHYESVESKLEDDQLKHRRVNIICSHKAGHIRICVYNEGKPFFPKKTDDSDAKPHGMGLYIIESFTVECTRTEDGFGLDMLFPTDIKTLEEAQKNKEKTRKAEQEKEDDYTKKVRESRILVVDDTEFNRILLKEILSNNKFLNIEMAVEGGEAIEKTYSFKPDLVILDLMMPNVDGFEYCETIRKDEQFRNVPILVQTAISSADQRIRVFKLGATDLVTKPFNPSELIARITIHLEKKHLLQSLQMYQQRVRHELQDAFDMQTQLMPSESLINICQERYNMQVSGHFEPSSELGGDFWGIHPIDDTHVALYICDFAGHGVTAALNTFRLHTIMQELFIAKEKDSGKYLSELNKRLCQLLSPMQYATMFFAIVDIEKHSLCYATAATPSPFIYEAETGKISAIDGAGLPIGIAENIEYPTTCVPFHPGDSIFLYSDALIETANTSGDFLNEKDLQQCLLPEGKGLTHSKAIPKLINTLNEHAANPLADDLTLTLYTRNA
jgi:sigma-B regulation protein RsbU (phosphoserine phosphatase)